MSRGFSLIELVVVIVIATILAALAIPRFTDSDARAGWFADQVAAGVRYAQRQAVAQRRCVFVTVTASQLALFYGDANCAITATPLTRLTDGAPYQIDAPSPVTIGPAGNFSFNGLGAPSAAVALAVGGRTVTVEVVTGYVRVE